MANAITFIRVAIAIVGLSIIQISPMLNLISIFFIILSMLLDALDGFIARCLNTTTLNGSIYDILADRIIENIFFIYFAAFSLFSFWFAIIIIIRGLTIDAIRTLYLARGKTAFGASTFHTLPWAKLLTCSKLSRGSYNTLKMITFILYAAILMPENIIFNHLSMRELEFAATICLWTTLTLAILRALPVLFEARFLNKIYHEGQP